jgi:hypothetical protein
LVALEKYTVQAILSKTIEEFRFASVNLAISTFALSEPFSSMMKGGHRCPANGLQVALWTKLVIDGDLTTR